MRLPIVATPRRHEPVCFPVLRMPKLEVLFADGSRLWLYQVGTDWLVRTFEHQDGVLKVDLRELMPELEREVNEAAEFDRPGTIFFLMRRRFASACAFVQEVLALREQAGQRLAA